jgi:hypothetical protein
MIVQTNVQLARCLVNWVNYELNDVHDEVDAPLQLLERDGERFTHLIRNLSSRFSEPSRPQNLDESIQWLSKINVMGGLSWTEFHGKGEGAFLSLLWNIAQHCVVNPEFDSLPSEISGVLIDNSDKSLESISTKAVKWAFSFAGPFVPRVAQINPNMSMIYDSKLLLAIIGQGESMI